MELSYTFRKYRNTTYRTVPYTRDRPILLHHHPISSTSHQVRQHDLSERRKWNIRELLIRNILWFFLTTIPIVYCFLLIYGFATFLVGVGILYQLSHISYEELKTNKIFAELMDLFKNY